MRSSQTLGSLPSPASSCSSSRTMKVCFSSESHAFSRSRSLLCGMLGMHVSTSRRSRMPKSTSSLLMPTLWRSIRFSSASPSSSDIVFSSESNLVRNPSRLLYISLSVFIETTAGYVLANSSYVFQNSWTMGFNSCSSSSPSASPPSPITSSASPSSSTFSCASISRTSCFMSRLISSSRCFCSFSPFLPALIKWWIRPSASCRLSARWSASKRTIRWTRTFAFAAERPRSCVFCVIALSIFDSSWT
mmetsp:Transcript_106261/g.298892  ORF Transcript_106261/g.298892 Transcript_106261/m.298892 type:complete len:247 (+) Transcript_106261:125-865(+)